jgi:hypothetical protein
VFSIWNTFTARLNAIVLDSQMKVRFYFGISMCLFTMRGTQGGQLGSIGQPLQKTSVQIASAKRKKVAAI